MDLLPLVAGFLISLAMKWFLICSLFVWLFATPCSCEDNFKDYIIILTAPNTTSGTSRTLDFLGQHISMISKTISKIKINKIYKNLAKMGFIGYSISTHADYARLSALPNVRAVEEVRYIDIAQQQLDSPNIEYVPYVPRFDDNEYTLTKSGVCTYSFNTTESLRAHKLQTTTLSTTFVYVLDTGVQSTHKSFGGRVEWGFDAISTPALRTDPHGHGTQVAGLIGGRLYGMSPKTRIIDVRVFDENGKGRTDDIIAGLDYVLGDYYLHKEHRGRSSSLVNLSFSGALSRILHYAIYMVSRVGAAGDSDSFSCFQSPAGSGFSLTVAATSAENDMPRTGSNYGDCIDIFAPGDDVIGPFIGESNEERKPLSGSSAATAIVTGLASRTMIAIYASDALRKQFDETVPAEPDQSPFLKRLLTSTRLAAYDDIRGAHLKAFVDCDITNVTAFNALLERELRLVVDTSKKVISGIEKAKSRYLKFQEEKRKNILLNKLDGK